jgi:hypothetical protein
MNERILKLAVEAGVTGYFAAGTEYATPIPLSNEAQKFAELIVRECARLAIEKQTENDVSGIVSKNPAKDFAYALVEHFGVEE